MSYLLFCWNFVHTRVLRGLKMFAPSRPAQLKPGQHQQEFEKSSNASTPQTSNPQTLNPASNPHTQPTCTSPTHTFSTQYLPLCV